MTAAQTGITHGFYDIMAPTMRDELLKLADAHGIDLVQASHAKLAKNALKYPVEKSKGSAKKYDEL